SCEWRLSPVCSLFPYTTLFRSLRLVLLVVGDELRRPAQGLAVQPMAHLTLDGDDDALLHLVADDEPVDFLLPRHRYSPFSLSTVFRRARSRRIGRSFAADSSWPIDFCRRSRNSCSSSSRTFCSISPTFSSRISVAFMTPSPARTGSRTSSESAASPPPAAWPRALPARRRLPSRTECGPDARRTPIP